MIKNLNKIEGIINNLVYPVQRIEHKPIFEVPLCEDVLRLNTNEHPFPLPAKVKKDAFRIFDYLWQYPIEDSFNLRNVAAEVYGFQPHNIIAGNGSSDILGLLYRSFLNKDDEIIALTPGFGFCDKLAFLQDAKINKMQWEKGYSLPIKSLAKCSSRVKFIIFSNPNNPTGTYISKKKIEQLLQMTNALVVIDEAYIDFSPGSAINLINHYHNLFIVKSFSKGYSSASVRIGLGFGHPYLIERLQAAQLPFNLNAFAQALGISIIRHHNLFNKYHNAVKQQRDRVSAELKLLNFDVIKSHANFIFAAVPYQTTGIWWKNALLSKRIQVAHFSNIGYENYIRIGITTKQQMDKLIKTIYRLVHDLK